MHRQTLQTPRWIILLCLGLCPAITAEPAPQIRIEHAPGIWNISNSSVIKRSDGVSVKTNSFGIGDITDLVKDRPVAHAYAREAAAQNQVASIVFWTTVPVGIAARLATYPLVEWEVITPQTGWVIFGSGIALSLVGALVSLHFFNNAKFSMYLGINEYNRSSTMHSGSTAYFGGMSFRL